MSGLALTVMPYVHHASEEGHVLLNDHGRSSDILARSWTNDYVGRGTTAASPASVRMLDTLIDPSLDGCLIGVEKTGTNCRLGQFLDHRSDIQPLDIDQAAGTSLFAGEHP